MLRRQHDRRSNGSNAIRVNGNCESAMCTLITYATRNSPAVESDGSMLSEVSAEMGHRPRLSSFTASLQLFPSAIRRHAEQA